MSVVVTVSNHRNLKKAQTLLGAKTESETIDIALEKIIEEFETRQSNLPGKDLPDDFFEDLFAEKTNSSDGETIQAIVKEREESNEEASEDFEINIHELNRIPPKKTIRVKANFKIGGRRKPMKYDFSDFKENNYDG